MVKLLPSLLHCVCYVFIWVCSVKHSYQFGHYAVMPLWLLHGSCSTVAVAFSPTERPPSRTCSWFSTQRPLAYVSLRDNKKTSIEMCPPEEHADARPFPESWRK